MRTTWLPALALSLCGAAARAVSPFDGCEVTEQPPGDRIIECPTFRAIASHTAPAFAEDGLLDVVWKGLSSKDRSARLERTTVQVAGAARKGVVYSGGGRPGELAIVPAGRDLIRLIGCEARPVEA